MDILRTYFFSNGLYQKKLELLLKNPEAHVILKSTIFLYEHIHLYTLNDIPVVNLKTNPDYLQHLAFLERQISENLSNIFRLNREFTYERLEYTLDLLILNLYSQPIFKLHA